MRRFGQSSARRMIGNTQSDQIEELREQLRDSQTQQALVRMVNNLPDIIGGRIISPAVDGVNDPENAGFSGTVMSGSTITINGRQYTLADLILGAVQFGVFPGGGAIAAGGDYEINKDGTTSYGLTFLHKFDATNGGIRRLGYIGMFVPDGATTPSLRIYFNEPASSNLVSHGSFDLGDETSWTDTNSTFTVGADSTYTYAARHDGTATGCPPTFTQTVTGLAASTVYQFLFASKMTSGYFPCNVTLTWKDGGGATLRTDTIIGGSSPAWVEKGGVYTSPASTTQVLITVHAGEIFSDISVSGFSLFALTSFSSIDFYDGKILINAYPGKPVNPLGLPQNAMEFANNWIWSATASKTIDNNQPYNFYYGTAAADANDGDTVDLSFVIAAGTYTIYINGVTTANSGKVDGYWDDSSVAAWTGDDWYSALTTRDVTKNHSVTFTTGGRHTLRLKVNGKTGSPGDYRMLFTYVRLIPSAYTVEA